MADSFFILDDSPSVQVLSGSQVIQTQRVEFVTKPSGIYGQRQVPRAAWDAGGAADWVAPLATAVEGLISGGLATYATWVQAIDPTTQLLGDAFEFIVAYDPGDGRPVQAATATVPVNSLTADTSFAGVLATYFGGAGATLDPAQTLRDVYDRLVQVANL